MEFTDRIDSLLARDKIRRADLVRFTGISEGTIRGWYKGQMPSAETLYKVAKYFNVTVEWLLTGNNPDGREIPQFTPDEMELIQIFRHLDERDKTTVLMLAKNLESQYSALDKKNFTVV